MSSSQLHAAVRNDNPAELMRLLAEGGNPNARLSSSGATLAYAAVEHSLACLQVVVDAPGADVDLAKNDGWNPLLMAAHRGLEEPARVLVDAGADVNKGNRNGATALYIACQNGHAAVVQLLLDAGADASIAKTTDGWFPALIAAHKPHLDALALLVRSGANVNQVNSNGASPLFVAAQSNHVDVINVLIAAGADVNLAKADGSTPLYTASDKGMIDTVVALLEAGASTEACKRDGWSPLLTCSHRGNVTIAQILLEAGAFVNGSNNNGATALYMAAQNGHVAVADLLLDYGADPMLGKTSDGWAPILIATHKPHLDIVALLIRVRSDLDVVNHNGATALYVACQKGNVELTHMLLDAGASPNIQKRTDGWSALHTAVHKPFEACVDALLDAGADINVQALDGTTPLRLAVDRSHGDVIALLLRRGADPFLAKTDGSTPLSSVASNVPLLETFLSGVPDLDATIAALLAMGCSLLTQSRLTRIRGIRRSNHMDIVLPGYMDVFPDAELNTDTDAAPSFAAATAAITNTSADAEAAAPTESAPSAAASLDAATAPILDASQSMVTDTLVNAPLTAALAVAAGFATQESAVSLAVADDPLSQARSDLGSDEAADVFTRAYPSLVTAAAVLGALSDAPRTDDDAGPSADVDADADTGVDTDGAGASSPSTDASVAPASALHTTRVCPFPLTNTATWDDAHGPQVQLTRPMRMVAFEHVLKPWTPASGVSSSQCRNCGVRLSPLNLETSYVSTAGDAVFALCGVCGDTHTQTLYTTDHWHYMMARQGNEPCAKCGTTATDGTQYACLDCGYYLCRSCFRPVARADPPTGLVVSCPAPRTLSLTWKVPAHGGSPIEAYRVFCRDAGSRAWGGGALVAVSNSVVLTDLLADTDYEVRVRAVTGAGDGADSAPIVASTVCVLPAPITGLVAVPRNLPGGEAIALAWQPRDTATTDLLHVLGWDSSGSLVYSMTVDPETDGVFLVGLPAGSQLDFALLASNADGVVPSSSRVTVTSAPAPPDATDVVAEFVAAPAGSDSPPVIHVAVNAGALGTAVSGLAVLASSLTDAQAHAIAESGLDAVAPSPESDATVSAQLDPAGGEVPVPGLVPGAPILLHLAAVGEGGVSDPLRLRLRTPPTAPQPVSDVRQLRAGLDSVVLRVDLPAFCGGANVSGLRVAVPSRPEVEPVAVDVAPLATAAEVTLRGLGPSWVGEVAVTALNTHGASDPVSEAVITAADSGSILECIGDSVVRSTSAVFDVKDMADPLGALAPSGSLIASVLELDAESGEPVGEPVVSVPLSEATQTVEATGLAPATRYSLIVSVAPPEAFAHVTLIPGSGSTHAATFTTMYAAPAGVSLLDVSTNSVRVTWDPIVAQESGGLVLDGYHIHVTTLADVLSYPDEPIFVDAATTEHVLSGLEPGTTYIVCMAAVTNGAGGDRSAETSCPTLPAAVSGLRCTNVSASALELVWDAASIDEGAVYEGWEVRMDDELVLLAPEPTAVLDNLSASTMFEIDVRGRTEHGVSPPLIVQLGTLPSRVSAVRVSDVAERSLVLSWDDTTEARPAPGAFPLVDASGQLCSLVPNTDYVVFMAVLDDEALDGRDPEAEPDMSYAQGLPLGSAETSLCVTGLRPGTRYAFRVTAVSEVGESEDGAVVLATTVAAAPGPPRSVRVVSQSSQSVSLSWKVPEFDGGSPITMYRGVLTETGPVPGTAHPFEVPFVADHRLGQVKVSGLEAGSAYSVSVLAVNALGESPSVSLGALVHTQASAPPRVQVVETTETSARLEWVAPPVAPPDTVRGYYVSVGGRVERRVAERSVEITDLYPGSSVTVVVTAVTSVGRSLGSVPVPVRTLRGVPAGITLSLDRVNSHIPIGHRSIALSWELATDGGLPLLGFTLTVAPAEGSSSQPSFVEQFAPGDRYTVIDSRLEPNTAYTFTLVARNKMGASAPSPPLRLATLGEHAFVKSKPRRNALCDVCKAAIPRGLFSGSCLECTDCGFVCHKKCVDDVVAGCRPANMPPRTPDGAAAAATASAFPDDGTSHSGDDDSFILL